MVNATSRTILVEQFGNTSVLQQVTVPRPVPKPNQVLIKVAYAGINFLDTVERRGLFTTQVPFIPGREGAGEIVEVGAEVEHGFKVGDRVAFMGLSVYADYVAADTIHLAKLPDHVSYEEGASLTIQGMTAWAFATRSYSIQKNDYIVVHAAAGGVGLLLCQIGRRLGAHIIGTVSTPEKAALALANGAEHVVIIPDEDYTPLEKKIDQLTDKKGVHAVFDSVGRATFETNFKIAGRSATLVIFGAASGNPPDFNIGRLTPKNLKITRVNLYTYITTFEEFDELFKEVLGLLQGENKIQLLVSKIYDFEDVQQAHSDLEGRKTTGKLLLKVN
ncbi:NADPH:quinone reductase, partial [Linnemannia zychae]